MASVSNGKKRERRIITCPHRHLDENGRPDVYLSSDRIIPLAEDDMTHTDIHLCAICRSIIEGAMLSEILHDGALNALKGALK